MIGAGDDAHCRRLHLRRYLHAAPILAALGTGLLRLAAKLTAALEKAEDGATEWVSDIRRDSYHTVWFDLHEDLLRVVGRERQE